MIIETLVVVMVEAKQANGARADAGTDNGPILTLQM